MKLSILALVAATLVALAASAGSRPSAAPSKATAETLKQLEGVFMQAAAEKGSAGYMSYYSDDAVELPNGADAIVGKTNIAAGMGFLDDKNNRLTWAPIGADISVSGDLGYTYGTFEFRSKDKDGKQTVDRGKYMTVWKRQADGSWKVAVDMGNSGKKEQ